MAKVGVSRKMKECLDFVRAYIAEHDGVSPSFQDIADGIGIASKSGVHRLIVALEERGLIQRMKDRARSLSVPDDEGTIHLTMPAKLQSLVRRKAAAAGISPEKYIQICILRSSRLATSSNAYEAA